MSGYATTPYAGGSYGGVSPAAAGAAPTADPAGHIRWIDMPATLSWLGAVGWYPGGDLSGRWVDEPSDLRWSTTDPALTWAAA